jgi:hypothetical protein
VKLSLAIALTVALSLIVAGSAQAYEWQIAKKVLPSLGISKEATSSSGGAFELSVPTLSLTVKCSSESGSGEILKGGTASASMIFTGCLLSGFTKVCTVRSPGKANGTLGAAINTEFLEVEVGGVEKSYDETSLFMEVLIEGELCPYAETEEEVTGTTAAEVPKVGEEATKRTMKFTKAGSELFFGALSASLVGESTTELAGAHAGQQQAVTPIKFNPAPVAFAGTGGANAKMVTISNDGFFRRIKLKQIGITGPYGLADPNNCEGKVLLIAPNVPNSCVITVTCNEKKPGVLFVKFDVLNTGGAVVGLGISEVDMTC